MIPKKYLKNYIHDFFIYWPVLYSHYMIPTVILNYCPNGGANQVCATEFDHDGNGLSELAGCWVTTISVHVRALVCISSKDKVPLIQNLSQYKWIA